jgi:hypothetical protein
VHGAAVRERIKDKKRGKRGKGGKEKKISR